MTVTRVTSQDILDGTILLVDLNGEVTALLVPDPSGEPDGSFLAVSSGIAVWTTTIDGGSP